MQAVTLSYFRTSDLLESTLESGLSLNQRHFNEGSQVTEKGLRVGWCCSLRIKNGWTHCWRECKMVELFWERVWQFLNMLKCYHMIQQFHS